MKTIKNIIILLLLFAVGINSGCKKDPVMYGKGFEAFKFVVKDALDVDKEYEGVISGDEIVVQLPAEVDVTKLKASFTMDNPRTIVQVGTQVQESGVTEQNFSYPIAYRVKAEDRSTRSYNVRIEKKIGLQSFGFYKADNPTLQDDYIAIIRGLSIEITIPETIDLSKLAARFQTTSGASLKVGGIVQESQKTINNYNNTLIYEFAAPGLATPLSFTTVISFTGPKWWMIGDKNIIIPTASNLKMAINPITKYPYLVYYRTGKNESGVSIEPEDRRVAVIGFTGNDWEYLGASTGISDTRADYTNISFDNAGTPYVAYKDYFSPDLKSTVLKYVNNSWAPVGSKVFSPMKVDKQSFTISSTNEPMVSIVVNSTDLPAFPRRTIYITGYSNNNWNNITPSGIPMMASSHLFQGLDGKTYVAILDRTNKVSMYKRENNNWQSIGTPSFGTTDGLPAYTSVYGAVDAMGNAYITYQNNVSSQRNNRVLKFNGSVWQELGSAGSSEAETDKYTLTIDPSGKLYFAYANNSGLFFRTFNTTTNNWNTARQIVSGKINAFDMQISSDAIPYIAVSTAAENRTTVYKYTVTK